MAEFTLPIGTSDPVNVCYGLPLFPTGAARAGIYGSARSFPLLDKSATLFVTRIKVGAYAEYVFGVCGPAVAFLFSNIQAKTSNQNGEGQLALTFSGPAVRGRRIHRRFCRRWNQPRLTDLSPH